MKEDARWNATVGPISHTPGIECWCKSCELIAFFANRLVEVHGESPMLDYIHLARRITGHEIAGYRDPGPPPAKPVTMQCPRCGRKVGKRNDGEPFRHRVAGGDWCGGYYETAPAYEKEKMNANR